MGGELMVNYWKILGKWLGSVIKPPVLTKRSLYFSELGSTLL